MRKRDTIKLGHERAIADQLLDALKIRTSLTRQGDPSKGEPDVIYATNGKTLGIEVATAYYDDSDAKQEWTVAAGERSMPPDGYEMRWGGVIGNPDQTICERIQGEINDKCSKTYTGADELWLCVEQRADLSDAESVERCIKTLVVPVGHQFTRIYLTYLPPIHEGSSYTARRQIYP